jgi:hypothetical protein
MFILGLAYITVILCISIVRTYKFTVHFWNTWVSVKEIRSAYYHCKLHFFIFGVAKFQKVFEDRVWPKVCKHLLSLGPHIWMSYLVWAVKPFFIRFNGACTPLHSLEPIKQRCGWFWPVWFTPLHDVLLEPAVGWGVMGWEGWNAFR